ncbi:hypothetical protein FR698_09880 [Pelomicrobium methylotrophicum]|uniref:Uncharacterized protein n=1 Tax=Pelomicrobium methylotrophicum TaxID=2602750 RepID=A0A5C7EKQ9_9PROT|nr:hypothetical protein FR698_09880 [Pelomicrobium methylotrophicum]
MGQYRRRRPNRSRPARPPGFRTVDRRRQVVRRGRHRKESLIQPRRPSPALFRPPRAACLQPRPGKPSPDGVGFLPATKEEP